MCWLLICCCGARDSCLCSKVDQIRHGDDVTSLWYENFDLSSPMTRPTPQHFYSSNSQHSTVYECNQYMNGLVSKAPRLFQKGVSKFLENCFCETGQSCFENIRDAGLRRSLRAVSYFFQEKNSRFFTFQITNFVHNLMTLTNAFCHCKNDLTVFYLSSHLKIIFQRYHIGNC